MESQIPLAWLGLTCGNEVLAVDAVATVVPEPSVIGLIVLSLLGLAVKTRPRARASGLWEPQDLAATGTGMATGGPT